MKAKVKFALGFTFLALILAASILTFLIVQGIFIPNAVAARNYVVKGVDVSAYQGQIDWNVLATEDIFFAFIKATEGSSFVDSRFAENWESAQKTNLRIGAYHFFSYDSAGKTQAENFIQTVPKRKNSLPPVIDIGNVKKCAV